MRNHCSDGGRPRRQRTRRAASTPCRKRPKTRTAIRSLLLVFPAAADFFRPVLVAVPIVEVVGDGRMPAAGFVGFARNGHSRFGDARLRTRRAAIDSGVSGLILAVAHLRMPR